MFVVIIADSSVDTILENVVSNSSYLTVYNSNYVESVEQLTTYDHLTLAGLRLQEILLFETDSMFDAVSTPVLVILDTSFDFSKFSNKRVDTDTVFFNSLHNKIKPTAIYGSIVAVTKVLRSANNFQHLLKNENNTVTKTPFTGACHELFQLIWYSQKIGLKVYEAK
jgi:hypothetical protein